MYLHLWKVVICTVCRDRCSFRTRLITSLISRLYLRTQQTLYIGVAIQVRVIVGYGCLSGLTLIYNYLELTSIESVIFTPARPLFRANRGKLTTLPFTHLAILSFKHACLILDISTLVLIFPPAHYYLITATVEYIFILLWHRFSLYNPKFFL